MNHERPIDRFIERLQNILKKEYLVIGTRRISGFTVWAVIALLVGITVASAFLASRSGTLEGGQAARTPRPVWSSWGNWQQGTVPLNAPTVQYRLRVKTSAQIVNGTKTRVRAQGYEERQCVKNCESLAGAPSACDTAAVTRKINDAAQAYLQNNITGAADAIRQAQSLLTSCQTSCDTAAIINDVKAAGAAYPNDTNGAIEKLRSAGTQLAVCQERASSASCSSSTVGQKFADAGTALLAKSADLVAQNLNRAADILAACRVSSPNGAAGGGSPSASAEFGPVSYSGRFMLIAMPLQDSAFEPRPLTSTFCGNGVNESQNGCKDTVELIDPGVQPGDKVEAWWIAHDDEFEVCNVARPGQGDFGRLNPSKPIPFIGSIVGNATNLTSTTATGKLGTFTSPTGVSASIHCGMLIHTPGGDVVGGSESPFYIYEPFGSGKYNGRISTGAAVSPLFPHASSPLAATGSFPTKEGRDIILTINGFKVKGDPGTPTYVSVEGASATATWQAPPEYTSCAINFNGQIVGLKTTPNWLRLPTSGSREIGLQAPNPAQVGKRGITPNPKARVMIMCAGRDYLPVVKAAEVVGQ